MADENVKELKKELKLAQKRLKQAQKDYDRWKKSNPLAASMGIPIMTGNPPPELKQKIEANSEKRIKMIANIDREKSAVEELKKKISQA